MIKKLLTSCFVTVLLLLSSVYAEEKRPCLRVEGYRRTISLNGQWQFTCGEADTIPSEFNAVVQVPGLVDMAKGETGEGQWYWYKRPFTVDAGDSEVALLKIYKAKYSKKIYLNGKLIGEHHPNFTPAVFDIKKHLLSNGKMNELIVRIGRKDNQPEHIVGGWDGEKNKFLSGIYDDVELILSDNPYIQHIQINPKLDGTVLVRAHIRNENNQLYKGPVTYEIRRSDTNAVVAVHKTTIEIAAGQSRVFDQNVNINNCRLWSPEDPFLYMLTVKTEGDSRTDRFGVKTFRFDRETRMPQLNGKTYSMRGTNICIFRFFGDLEHGSLPWDETWVRMLIRNFKSMHWNSVRFCIGFPPRMWYRICDEEGFLVQDEFPLWHMPGDKGATSCPYTAEQIALEATDWIYEHCNYPCIYMWDMCNETYAPATGQAINKVRSIDIQNRLWENGTSWTRNLPAGPDDPVEAHPYLFSFYARKKFKLSGLNTQSSNCVKDPMFEGRPVIVNEYGWLWITRRGEECDHVTKTGDFYRDMLQDEDTVENRRYLYATYLAALTEFWRAGHKDEPRHVNIIHHFCGLGYSRTKQDWEKNATSDNFIEPISSLQFEKNFYRYVRDAFAPVCICIDKYFEAHKNEQSDNPLGGSKEQVHVLILNDTEHAWENEVHLKIYHDHRIIDSQLSKCSVPAWTKHSVDFNVIYPDKPGRYQLVASYYDGQEWIESVRDFRINQQVESEN